MGTVPDEALDKFCVPLKRTRRVCEQFELRDIDYECYNKYLSCVQLPTAVMFPVAIIGLGRALRLVPLPSRST